MSHSSKGPLNDVRRHARQLVRELDVVRSGYMDTGYTLAQCHVMFELSAKGTQTLMQLTESLLIDKSNLSRAVKKLVQLELVKSVRGTVDSRQKFFSLTARGNRALQQVIGVAENQIGGALKLLTQQQQQTVVEGLRLFESSLRRQRLQEGFSIRRIRKKDNLAMAAAIRTVLTEFGCVGEGYSIVDPEIDDMYGNYKGDRRCYFVIEDPDGEVVGGGGVDRLTGGDRHTCELRKMYFLSPARGIGLGSRLVTLLLDKAEAFGYRQCYLETLERMESANLLYQSHGFERLKKPLGATGHDACDRYYLRAL